MNIFEIVSRAPFSTNDGLLYVGLKETKIFAIEPHTGEIQICMSRSNQCSDLNLKDRIILMRSEHSIKAIELSTGFSVWNISLGEFTTSSIWNNFEFDMFADLEKNQRPNHTLVSGMDGSLEMLNSQTGNLIWHKIMPSPVLYIQSNLSLADLIFLPEITLKMDHRDGMNGVYVGEHSGTLIAIENTLNHSFLPYHEEMLPDRSFWWPLHTKTPIPKMDDLEPFHIPDKVCHNSQNFPCILGLHYILNDQTFGSYPVLRLSDRPNFINQTTHVEKEDPNQYFIKFVIFASFFILTLILLYLTIILFSKKKNLALKTKFPTSQPNGILIVGKLKIEISNVLGYGSSGTVVFEGLMDNRKVAVKRILKSFYSIAETEILALTQSDEHPNVIRYFTKEEDENFIYLAISYLEKTLTQFVLDDNSYMQSTEKDKINMIYQMTQGLSHLHNIGIVHRDIKPDNILVGKDSVIKISDMGIAKKIEPENNSFSTITCGTKGWQAPEITFETDNESCTQNIIINGSEKKRFKLSKKVDIFSLGCVFYYLLTRKHPFGDKVAMRETNILNSQYILEGVSLDAFNLISKMLSSNPDTRPSIKQILDHPFFWDSSKKLRFLKDTSDYFEFQKPTSRHVIHFETEAQYYKIIPNNNWTLNLPKDVLDDLNKFRKYNPTKVRDLLRVIRNKAHHYRDLDPETQKIFGSLPDEFLNYFCQERFPLLFSFSWEYMKLNCSTDEVFKEFFKNEKQTQKDSFPKNLILKVPEQLSDKLSWRKEKSWRNK